jgi:integrase
MPATTRPGRAFAAVAGAEADPFTADAKADRTWITYQSALNNFAAWCEQCGACALPADMRTIKAWLQHLSMSGLSGTTCHTYLTALCTQHRLAGPPIDRRALAETLKAITKRSARPRCARPLLADDLKAILQVMNAEQLRDQRDACVLMLGFAAALRQSEIAGLDWLQVVLVTSKTAQTSECRLPIADTDMPSLRPWVERWGAGAKLEPGQPMFRGIDSFHKLNGRRFEPSTVSDVVRARVRQEAQARGVSATEAWQLARQYSGHSLRAGMCTASALAGTFEFKIRDRARHRSAETTAKYIRAAPGHGLGDQGSWLLMFDRQHLERPLLPASSRSWPRAQTRGRPARVAAQKAWQSRGSGSS